MSKLEELIEQYCPDGVKWKHLEEFCEIKTGKGITKKDSNENGTYPIISGGVTPMGYYHIFNREGRTVTISRVGANAGLVSFIDKKFYLNDKCFSIIPSNGTNTKFLYYILSAREADIKGMQSEGGVPTINTQKVGSIEIPLPPLPVQEEIVRVLDAFTELQAELQAELQKRLQQYEYYKWNIFEGLSCPTKHITDVALVKARVGWQRLTTAEYQETGDYYLITGTDFKNGKIDFNSCVFVSKERYEMDPNIIVGKGDILITKDGTLGKVAFMAEEPNKPTTLNSGVFRIHTTDPQVSSRYLFHYFTSKYFTDFVNSVKTGSTIPHLTQQGLVSLNIPIPSLEEQNRVVSILDKFEALTNDLTSGLPAEMEKRRQQYEFYRDKLLTFKRKEA